MKVELMALDLKVHDSQSCLLNHLVSLPVVITADQRGNCQQVTVDLEARCKELGAEGGRWAGSESSIVDSRAEVT